MRLFNFLGVVVLLLCAAPVSKAGVYQEMKGLRSEAMGGAHRGLGTSNDTLFLNPAGMAMLRRYSVDLLYGYTSIDNLNHISVTAVDSKSGPLAGAVGYTHDRGELNGLDAKFHRAYGAIAYPIFEGVGLGLTGRYVRGDIERVDGTTEHLSFFTGDVGLAMRLADRFGFGVTYHNIIDTDHEDINPPGIGVGLSYSSHVFTAAADALIDISDKEHRRTTYHVGTEYFAVNELPLRLGYRSAYVVDSKSGALERDNIVSAGIGWVNKAGGFEATYTQSIDRSDNWSAIGAVKFYL